MNADDIPDYISDDMMIPDTLALSPEQYGLARETEQLVQLEMMAEQFVAACDRFAKGLENASRMLDVLSLKLMYYDF